MMRIHNKCFRNLLALATCLTLANPVAAAPQFSQGSGGAKRGYASQHTTQAPAPKYKVKLRFVVTGAVGSQELAIKNALVEAGIKAKFHEAQSKDKSTYFSASFDRRDDLEQIVAVLKAAAPDSYGQAGPTFDLIVYASMDQDSNAKMMEQLGKVKGIDATHSSIDIPAGELHVRLTGDEFVTADDILRAVSKGGLSGSFAKKPPYKTSTTGYVTKVFTSWTSWMRFSPKPTSPAPQPAEAP